MKRADRSAGFIQAVHVCEPQQGSHSQQHTATAAAPARPHLSRCHRLTRRSSAEMKVSQSLLSAMELMWYVCAFEYDLQKRSRWGAG